MEALRWNKVMVIDWFLFLKNRERKTKQRQLLNFVWWLLICFINLSTFLYKISVCTDYDNNKIGLDLNNPRGYGISMSMRIWVGFQEWSSLFKEIIDISVFGSLWGGTTGSLGFSENVEDNLGQFFLAQNLSFSEFSLLLGDDSAIKIKFEF